MTIVLMISLISVVIIYVVWKRKIIDILSKGSIYRSASGLHENAIQELFFNTAFTLMGYVARRDGPVNDKEIKRTETFMKTMNLNAPQKRKAIALFKRGAKPDYDVQRTLGEFKSLVRKRPNLTQILLVYLVNLARADGFLADKEITAVREVASGLGYSDITFAQLLKMLSAQDRFNDEHLDTSFKEDAASTYHKAGEKSSGPHHKKRYRGFADDTEQSNCAYDALGLTPAASDAEVKKAYRTLVSQFHPDKLIGKGLPDFMVQAMTERFKYIQSAYDCIKKEKSTQ